MNFAEVIGGAAVGGLAVLIGLAVLDDNEPDSIVSPPPATVGAPGSVSPTGTGSTVTNGSTPISVVDPVTSAPETTEEPTTVPETTEPPATTSPPTSSTTARTTTTTTVPDRSEIRVRVLNGGRPSGTAQDITDEIADLGFQTIAPTDAELGAGWTVIFYRPEFLDAAVEVNEIVGTDPALVIEPSLEDPNWAAHEDEVDVLVILGTE